MTSPPRRPTRQLVILLAAGMLISGTSTSLWMKYQDLQCVANCTSPDPRQHKTFEQPILQSETMMLGEMLCLVFSYLLSTRLNPYRPAPTLVAPPLHPSDAPPVSILHHHDAASTDEATPLLPAEGDPRAKQLSFRTKSLFAGPAICDILGTTSMNMALLWVPVSVYQMLKGALTLWVALFSVLFLGRRLVKAQLVAVAMVALGVAIVGYSNVQSGKGVEVKEGSHPVAGVVVILLAQIFIATQFVIEEKIMESHSVAPLQAVGYEGISGFIIIAIGMAVLHLLIGRTDAGRGGYFDAPNAFRELGSSPKIWGPAVVFAISVAGTNGFGLAVTKNVSATARSTIDTCRTCSIWVVSLFLGWESLKYLQLVGFALLVYGTFIFNGIVTWPDWTGLRDESSWWGKMGERKRRGSHYWRRLELAFSC